MLSSKTKRRLKVDQRQIAIDSIEIAIPSPQQILTWGERILENGKKVGIIKNSKTVNYKRFTPFRDGLFCERIFGPVTSFVCACGKKQPHSKVSFCEKCEVEYIDQRSRRYRLGYISLLSPVTHIWYLKGRGSYLSLFLGKRKKTIISLAYCNSYLIEHGPKGERPLGGEALVNKAALCHSRSKLFRSADAKDGIAGGDALARRGFSNRRFDRLHWALKTPSAKKILMPLLTNRRFDRRRLTKLCFVSKALHHQEKPLRTSANKAVLCKPYGSSCKALRTNRRFVWLTKLCFVSTCMATGFDRFETPLKRRLLMPLLTNRRFVSHTSANKERLLTSLQSRALLAIARMGKSNRQERRKAYISRSWGQSLQESKAVPCKKIYIPLRANTKPSFVKTAKLCGWASAKLKSSALAKRGRLCKPAKAGPAQHLYGFRRHTNLRRFVRRALLVSPIKSRLLKGQNQRLEERREDVSRTRGEMPLLKRKIEQRLYFSSKRSRYGTYLYRRQHALPFLPSFVSHFYLRDALLAFIYSSAACEDLPLVEYCCTKRWEPLRDVHKFMAHKTVDNLKAGFSNDSIDSINNFSKKIQYFEKVRGYKIDFRGCKSNPLTEKRDPWCSSLTLKRRFFVTDKSTSFLNKAVFSRSENSSLQEPSSSALLTPPVLLPFIPLGNGAKGQDRCSRSFVQKEIDLPDNERKTTLSEDSNKSLLSGLELTAIREILSYTGGGALQQLLKSFNQHQLCKFLFAESQILRVLYETRVAIGFGSEPVYNPFFEQERFEPISTSGSTNSSKKDVAQKPLLVKDGFDRLETPLKRAAFVPLQSRDDKALLGLHHGATDLQKKQIVRISRRIYKVARRLKVTQLLTRNHRKPEWMILSHLPVLPPDLRPILQMSEKVIVASDLNIMYQRVIYRNNRHLRVRFIDFHLVTAIQRLVQDAVDRLIENGKGGSKPYYTQGGRPLKSLSDILKGKKGRFRLNLLGKRVDFSGRSVIVVSPHCQIHECGLPKDIALELYHYFLLRQLIVKKQCASIVTAKKMIKSKSSLMWGFLRELMYHHPVLLNRAPTLHRLGIQAFQPKLVLGNAIWLHPLVCSGFNADFDGDQMGVHLPLSFAARAESWDLLWSRNNLLSPATGQPMLVPSQDMVLGFYYMTAQASQNKKVSFCLGKNEGQSFKDTFFLGDEADQIFDLPFKNRDFTEAFLGGAATRPSGQVRSRALHRLTNRRFVWRQDLIGYIGRSSRLQISDLLANKTFFASKIKDFIGAFKGPRSTNRFLSLKEITTSFQIGKIKLHQPVWLYWSGKIENEERSQRPVELRVHGFGVQQSVYEKSISSNFFQKANVVAVSTLGDAKPCIVSKSANKISDFKGLQRSALLARALKSSIVSPKQNWDQAFPFKAVTAIGDENEIRNSSSSISLHPKTCYIRTTAGRVLMNNLILEAKPLQNSVLIAKNDAPARAVFLKGKD